MVVINIMMILIMLAEKCDDDGGDDDADDQRPDRFPQDPLRLDRHCPQQLHLVENMKMLNKYELKSRNWGGNRKSLQVISEIFEKGERDKNN